LAETFEEIHIIRVDGIKAKVEICWVVTLILPHNKPTFFVFLQVLLGVGELADLKCSL